MVRGRSWVRVPGWMGCSGAKQVRVATMPYLPTLHVGGQGPHHAWPAYPACRQACMTLSRLHTPLTWMGIDPPRYSHTCRQRGQRC